MKLTAEQRDLIRCIRDGAPALKGDLHPRLADDSIVACSPSKEHRANCAAERRDRHSYALWRSLQRRAKERDT